MSSDDDSDSSSSYFSSSESSGSDMESVNLDAQSILQIYDDNINLNAFSGTTQPPAAAADELIIDVYSDGDGDEYYADGRRRNMHNNDIEYRLQTSIFYVEPVTHITCQTMFVNSASNTLAQIDTRVMRLAVPNTIDRFDIGRIIKASRYAPDGSLKFRLGSLFVYNPHVPPAQLSIYVTNPDAFSFVTPLTSISSFIIKPTMACFHSLNSIHIVLHSIGVVAPKAEPVSRRTVTITKTALATRRSGRNRNTNSRMSNTTPKYRQR